MGSSLEPAVTERSRLIGLDGIRGLAALFVVLHHCWLMAFPGFPADNGPVWLGWLAYGHFAVVAFIVLSGFSLAVSPARSGWRLSSLRRFGRRRAWRILPPYWAALVYSLVIAWTLVPQPGEGVPTGKSVLMYGLLLQDVSGSPSPNGAFWSIAVEAQLYFFFPLMLLILRRAGAAVLLVTVTALVAPIGLLAPSLSLVAKLMRFTPQFAVLFAVGVVAAGVTTAGPRWQRVRWDWLTLLATIPVIVLLAVRGLVWTAGNFFWVDLALGPAIGLLLVSVATGRPAAGVRLLDTRPIRSLGSFSYSLYLVHAPIVVVVSEKVVTPHLGHGLRAFAVTLALAVPVSLLVARLFAAVFEIPFQRHRSWPALKAALQARRTVLRADAAPEQTSA